MLADDLDAAPMADAALGLAIPVIDLTEPAQRVVDAVARACAEWGFFQIVGHGVDPALMAAAEAETQAFFTAPKANKRALSRSRDNPWGFYDRELTKTARDKKEIFDIGPDVGSADALSVAPFEGATPWPDWRPSFAPTMRAFFKASEQVSAQLLDFVSTGIGEPAETLRAQFRPQHTSFLRLNFYPVDDPLADETSERADLGIHHHTDAGALTVLMQDAINGLQVYRDGRWHNVAPLAGAFVVNIGDVVQVWSNDLYKAPVHRVLAMERTERRSLPFFYNPSYAALVAPLGSAHGSDGAHYRAVAWGEFRRLRADGDFANYGPEVQISDYRIA